MEYIEKKLLINIVSTSVDVNDIPQGTTLSST